ncbi:MAG: hypothetical protein OEM62_05185 [Acidobacteriota bacterium]|nr:hypothetical protein [Acidobacteriota bacterium]
MSMTRATIAYFVTPHGFGHAARAAAVMESVGRLTERIRFDIVTTVPEWFFAQSLSVEHRLRSVVCDVGLVQLDPVTEDVGATVTALRDFWPTLPATAASLVREWEEMPPRVVVSDISPLGLEVARQLGVSSVLVENFTWDWIYDAYRELAPELDRFGERYADLVVGVDHHLRCEPACGPGVGTLRVAPVSREPRGERGSTRRALGIEEGDGRPLVLLTMGGLGWGPRSPFLRDDVLVVTLGGVSTMTTDGSVIRLPDRSPVYPPDLIRAADVVVGKLGYSTVTECYRSGTRLGFVRRERFPESTVLAAWVRDHLPSAEMRADELSNGRWRATLEKLLDQPRLVERREQGADEIARLLVELVEAT